MRLRTKYALVLVALMLVLGSVLFISTEQFKQELIQQEQQEIDRSTNLTAEQIDESIRDSEDHVRFFANRPDIRTREDAAENLPAFVNGSEFRAAQVVHPNGTIIAFIGGGEYNETGRKDAIGKDISDRPYIERMLTTPLSTTISNPEQDERGVTIFTISSKLENGGLVVVAIDIRNSGYFRTKRPLETESQTVEVVATDVNGNEVTLDPAEETFEQNIVSTATIESADWTLTVRRDRTQLTQRLSTLRTVQAAGLLLVFLSFLALGVWEYRTTLRQTERLLEGFDALQGGEFDHEVDLNTAQEWTQMSTGFNQLATGLEEREQAIREREQQLSVVNRVLRHNLKNEMTVIQGHAELLPMLDSQEKREETKDTIRETAERLLGHSKKARHINSAIESAEKGTQIIKCSRLVRNTVETVARDHPGVDVETEVPDDIDVDAISALQYAIESIVENAFEHNENDEPFVEVAVEEVGRTVEIKITDNGPGIPAHEIEVLGSDTETGLEHGSGVGLWLAFWVVKRSNGKLLFKRHDPVGTTVTIVLPKPAEDDEDEDD